MTPKKYQLTTSILFCVIFLFYNTLDYHVARAFLQVSEPKIIDLNNLPDVPVLKSKLEKDTVLNAQLPTTTSLNTSVSAKSVLVYDITSGTPLIVQNENHPLAPASTTKLMTALVALEIYSPETLFAFAPSDFRFGFNHDFRVGEELTVKDLITAMLVESANEAAFNLARNHPQGEAGFIERMNQKEKELGLKNTHFTNPAGFDNPNHYSTANDLNLLAIKATENPLLKDVVKLKKTEIADFSRRIKHQVSSTNKLLLYNPQVIGVKTGTTPGAKEVLITQFKDSDRVIQVIVLGSDDRYEDTLNLFSAVKNHYRWLSADEFVKLGLERLSNR
jgi:D-alanyl-D-alanine carboxypeptidase